MVGRHRLDNLHRLILEVEAAGVSGDVMEAGVWRGGACIFAAAVIEAYGIRKRRVVLADSFAGLPHPSTDEDSDVWKDVAEGFLSVPLGRFY